MPILSIKNSLWWQKGPLFKGFIPPHEKYFNPLLISETLPQPSNLPPVDPKTCWCMPMAIMAATTMAAACHIPAAPNYLPWPCCLLLHAMPPLLLAAAVNFADMASGSNLCALVFLIQSNGSGKCSNHRLLMGGKGPSLRFHLLAIGPQKILKSAFFLYKKFKMVRN